MKKKLTLSLDESVIEEAKKFARRRHKSLSRMVESYLRQVAHGNPPDEDITPLVAELSGVLSPPSAEQGRQEYRDYLREKYR
ncbi:DUF6364 family protein [Geoalkalibacter halelectricus]|uniref:DUF6364 family protein n=1 Tax=Geoalkalibacter halelectricus TaxID=2847045 RepID=UPI003D1F63B8